MLLSMARDFLFAVVVLLSSLFDVHSGEIFGFALFTEHCKTKEISIVDRRSTFVPDIAPALFVFATLSYLRLSLRFLY